MSRREVLLPVSPARWNRPAVPAPDPAFTQEQLCDRRRRRLDVHYTGSFDLTAEISDIVTPLAVAVSRLPWPLAMCRDVDAVADGVAEMVHVAAGLVAESKAADGRTRRLAADLAVRPRQPAIADEQIVFGSWSTTLSEYAGPLDDDLAALLDRALPPMPRGCADSRPSAVGSNARRGCSIVPRLTSKGGSRVSGNGRVCRPSRSSIAPSASVRTRNVPPTRYSRWVSSHDLLRRSGGAASGRRHGFGPRCPDAAHYVNAEPEGTT